jgi:hypothetical protein
VFASTDNGNTWIPANPGLPETPIYQLAKSGRYLFAGTSKHGVWRIRLSDVTSVEELPAPKPAQYVLSQNFPNPFNPSTTIQYDLPQRSRVTLMVFNSLGQVVAVLHDGEQQAGSYEVRFDRGTMASGVYYCRMMAGSFVAVQKLVMLR